MFVSEEIRAGEEEEEYVKENYKGSSREKSEV